VSTSDAPPGGPIDPADLLGTVFADRYRLSSVVGAGANTTVFDALDNASGRTVTVKLIRPEVTLSPAFDERFDETMRRVGALSHPNIAALYDWGHADLGGLQTAFVVVEQLSGGSLRDMFDRARLLSPSQALAVGLDACRGLDYAHRRGFVHGELTPSKLVFGDDRRLRITDFGLANLLNGDSWQRPDSVATHTAWYASPEQGLSQPIDDKTDVYALCLTLQEAVTGNVPFKNDSTVASLSARIGRLMPVSADLGPLASVLEHAGRPEADERSSAAQFAKELVQVASKLPRPQPLPLLSTGLFETPAEQLRSPDDPTGGVVRPADFDVAMGSGGDAPLRPAAPAERDLVILPLDSAIGERPAPTPDADPTDADPTDADPTRRASEPSSIADAVETQVMAAYVPPEAPARRRRFPWKVLLSLLVIAALAVLGVLATQLFRTPVYAVPDLVEMPVAEAQNLIATNRWEVTRERQRSDVVPVVGQVVRTVPQAGVELAEGEPFLIVVSDGPTLRELPESTGLPLSEAQTRLAERGLDVRTVEEFDEDVPDGVVISWSVPGDATLGVGALVEPETPVELVISSGPAPRTVPDLVGLAVGAARGELEDVQLTLHEAGQEFSDDIPLGSVVSQAIEAGSEVARGIEVQVIVSKGPDIVSFPDISGAATYEAAAAILVEAGFEPRLTLGDAQAAVRTVRIDGEEPEVGETFRRGTRVDIRAF
jgi:serine/threonine-protein kinase